ncbi:hypothetical protein DFP72DRAFT_839535 [Ephemerocybe angulata]|uniref:Uncharacterized protein n=1 Tax=Ephemerocybe angulata TaxID=980116 RepID=A0A8H6MHM9_9AGAR|nr:hypothetical protein DFP72DRAFT_839535 [Tulosesus angulatus]
MSGFGCARSPIVTQSTRVRAGDALDKANGSVNLGTWIMKPATRNLGVSPRPLNDAPRQHNQQKKSDSGSHEPCGSPALSVITLLCQADFELVDYPSTIYRSMDPTPQPTPPLKDEELIPL